MRIRNFRLTYLFPALLFVLASLAVVAQDSTIDNKVVSFVKQQRNTGFLMNFGQEREELRTEDTRYYEEQNLLNGSFFIERNAWNLLDFKQEEFNIAFKVGPYGASGNWVDSSSVSYDTADEISYGIRTSLNVDYLYRYYYDPNTYTVFDVNVYGRYDLYKQQLDGTSVDSLGVSTPIDESNNKDRFRFGFTGKVGWGTGRLSPMNHLMTADYLLTKYYPGRIFSDYEIAQFAQVIANIKHARDCKTGHIPENEMQEVIAFISKTFVLASPEMMSGEWQFSEFDPRYQGSRFEIGPHFQYYNREPDFLFGGYLQYDNAKYINVKWNRNFSAGLVYNRYAKNTIEYEDGYLNNNKLSRDWATADINFGWSYFPSLKTQFDFGLRYVPGIELNNFEDIGSISHNAIPYVAYYTQLNAKSRVQLDFSWRITDGEQFLLPGPNFTLAYYMSRY